MQNLMTRYKNTTIDCGLCMHSPVYPFTILSYSLISLPINGWILWLMASSPVFWTDRMEVSEFHLVITELLVGCLEIPLIIILIPANNTLAATMAKLADMLFNARVHFQSSICFERYIAVIHPTLYLRYKPLRYRMSFCCGIWLLNILMCTGQLFTCDGNPLSVGTYTTSFAYSFIVNSFCCAAVLRALKKPSPGEGEREGSHSVKKRAFNIVLIYQVTTVVSFGPLITMFLLVRKIDWLTLCIWQPLAYSLMIWLGVINPIFYLRRNRKKTNKKWCCLKV